jgi:hypothetical protein
MVPGEVDLFSEKAKEILHKRTAMSQQTVESEGVIDEYNNLSPFELYGNRKNRTGRYKDEEEMEEEEATYENGDFEDYKPRGGHSRAAIFAQETVNSEEEDDEGQVPKLKPSK